MRIEKNFCLDDLKPEFKSLLHKSHITMKKISDELNRHGIAKMIIKKLSNFFLIAISCKSYKKTKQVKSLAMKIVCIVLGHYVLMMIAWYSQIRNIFIKPRYCKVILRAMLYLI